MTPPAERHRRGFRLRGAGNSERPQGGYDKKTMAKDIRELVHKLGYKQVSLVGHDIGLMVAYAYAAQYPNEVSKGRPDGCVLPFQSYFSGSRPQRVVGFPFDGNRLLGFMAPKSARTQ
jgi:pimeloyl-ACP methyl ester carboxylesterase